MRDTFSNDVAEAGPVEPCRQWAYAPSDFVTSVKPIPRGVDYAHHITTCPTDFQAFRRLCVVAALDFDTDRLQVYFWKRSFSHIFLKNSRRIQLTIFKTILIGIKISVINSNQICMMPFLFYFAEKVNMFESIQFLRTEQKNSILLKFFFLSFDFHTTPEFVIIVANRKNIPRQLLTQDSLANYLFESIV